MARVTYKRRETLNAPSGSPLPGGGDALENVYGVTAAYNYVVSNHWINEARVGYTGVNSAQIMYLTNAARSNYNALTIAANKRMSKGLPFQVSYNHAKNLSNGGGYAPTGFAGEGGGTLSDPSNPNLDYGNVAFTRRDRIPGTYLYPLPFRTHSKMLNEFVANWELAGVVMFQSGPYLTVVASGADPSGANFPNLQGRGRADMAPGGVSPYPSHQTPQQWLNTAAFAVPANHIGRFGNEPVGAAEGPGTQAASMPLFHSVEITERTKFRLGISAANLFNHPNYGTPALTLNTSTFGTITRPAVGGGRGSAPTAAHGTTDLLGRSQPE